MLPQLAKELTLVDVQTAASKVEQGPAGQRKDAQQLHHRKTAAGLLSGGLGIRALVLGRVRHREIGAIDELKVTPSPAALGGDVAFQPIGQLFMNAQQGLIRQSCTSLTIGARVRRDVHLVAQCPPGLYLTYRLTAGRGRREHLGEKSPEGQQRAKEPLTTTPTVLLRAKQRVGNHRAKSLAQPRNRIGLPELRRQLIANRTGWTTEEQGAKLGKKGSGGRHELKYIYALFKSILSYV